MVLFGTDSLVLCYRTPALAKKWWMHSFDCKEAKVPAEWDCPLPSDVALKLPGQDEPTILLCDSAEVREAGYDRSNDHPIIFTSKVTKAQQFLAAKGTSPGPIQQSGGAEFFEIRDLEGNVIEICEQP